MQRQALRRVVGLSTELEDITEVVERFDAAGFLDSERFRQRRRTLEDSFRQNPVRPAAHAGGALADLEGAEADQRHAVALLEGLGDAGDDGVDGTAGFGLGDFCFVGDGINQFGFVH